jgi:hypothetical protein
MIDWEVAKRAAMHRYIIRQNDAAFWEERFKLFDTLLRRVVFRCSSLSLVVKEAQKRNGFTPRDGDPRTFALQITEIKDENRRTVTDNDG